MITFHKILAGCEAGKRGSWHAFLSEYTPLVFRLAEIYLPSSLKTRQALWRTILDALAANTFERLRTFDHQAEQEFLTDLRSFVLEQGLATVSSDRDLAGAPRPTPETVTVLLKGLPLVHQEIMFLKLAGYSDATLEKMLRITPSIAAKGLERLYVDYAMILKKEQDLCLWPAAWLDLLRQARAAKTEECPPLRQFVRVRDGQTGWSDKELLEKHVTGCLHCLDRWTALRELVYFRHATEVRPREELEALLSKLPLQAEPKKKSVLRRAFGS